MSQEVGALRVSLSIDTADFTRRVQDINSRLRAVRSEFNAAGDGTRGFGNTLEGTRARIENLTRQLDLQRQKVQALRQRYQETAAAEGENSRATVDLAAQYNNQLGVMRRMESQLSSTEGHMQRLTAEEERNASALGRLRTRMQETGSRMADIGGKMQSAGQSIATTFGVAFAGVAGGLGLSAKKAMDFEQEMSNVKSVMSPDDVKKFGGQLQQLAITMGAKTKYSATEAAQGIEELVKAGVSVKDIMSGGLDGALSLATAGELNLADAATIASTALNAFKADNISVSKAADILAGAANASATDVGELKFGLSSVSAVASGVGLSFKDTTTALAAFAQNGLKGMDAGTSLKSMLLRLSPSTSKAADMMQSLGLATTNAAAAYKYLSDRGFTPVSHSSKDVVEALKKMAKEQAGAKASASKIGKAYDDLAKKSGYASSAFYDNNGKLKSMSDIAGTLQKSLSGLNSEQRQNALQVMFGTDAIRAGNILYKEGSKGINDMAKAMGKVTAADTAAKKLDNVKGAIEQLKGSVETAQISIGNALLPAIKTVAKVIGDLVNKFNSLSPGMQHFIAIGGVVAAIFLGIVTALGGLLAIVGGAVAGIGQLSLAFEGLAGIIGASFLPVTGIILGVIGLAALLFAAWKNNFGGLRDFTTNVWNLIVQKFNEVKAYIMPIISQLVSYISQQWKTIGPMVSTVMNAIGAVIKFILPFVFDTIKFYLDAAINVFKGAFNIIAGVIKFFVALFSGDWKGMWAGIKQVLSGAVQLIWGLFNLWFVGRIAGIFGKFINKGLGFLTKFAVDGAKWVGKFVGDTFGRISSWGGNIVRSVGSAMSRFFGAIGRWLGNATKEFVNFVLDIPKKIGSLAGKMVSIGVNIVKGIWNGITSMGSWLVGKLKSWALAVIPGPIAKVLHINSPSRYMRDKIGKWIPAGLADGITGNIGAVRKAVNQMTSSTIPTNLSTSISPIITPKGSYSPGSIGAISGNNRTESNALIKKQDQQINMLQIQNGLLSKILEKDNNTYLDGKEVYNSTKKYQNSQTNIRNIFKGVTSI